MFATLSLETLLLMAVGLLVIGVAAGLIAGLLGVGGGIVIVPVLVPTLEALGYSSDVSMHVAVGTSLATIIVTSISSARAHHRKGAVDFDLLRLWGPALVAGSLLGGVLAKVLGGNELKLVFGVIAFFVAFNMGFPKKWSLAPALPASRLVNSAIAGVIGTISALMGIGGGSLSVPTLSAFSYPVHRAVGTAALFGTVIAVPGMLGFVWAGWGVENLPPFSFGYVNLLAAGMIVPTTMLTAPQGARLAHSLQPAALKRAFAVFLAITAARMLWKALAG